MIWKFQSPAQIRVERLTKSLEISPTLARILINRGIIRADSARYFLQALPSQMPDPFLMADMDNAVERLSRSFREREKIFIFGDYDVDGVTSIAVLSILLEAAGVPFQAHQPNRLREGYGLNEASVDLARKAGAGLLIALDCGTEAYRAVARAIASGLDVIVIDHHKQRGELPPALAVLNPNRDDCPYPFKELAAVGVAFKFLQAGEQVWQTPLPWERLWQLAALGTVADVAPLVGENRILVKTGLRYLRRNRDPVFRALVNSARLDPEKLSAHHLSFQLAPRLNAAGRMGIPEIGRNLLTARSPDEMRRLATRLNILNRNRQSIQAEIIKEVEEKIRDRPEKYLGSVIVVEGKGWNKGIVGIVASKIQEKHYRPTVIIALEGDVGVGSARSIPGFDLFSAISRCGHLLEKFGGHKYAAGITIKKNLIDRFRDCLTEVAAETLSDELLQPRLMIDAELNLSEAGFELLEELEQLEPFGLGNPRPVFFSSGLTLRGAPRIMGKRENHLKVWLQNDNSCRESVGWEMAPRLAELGSQPLDVAYQLKVNEFRNRRRLQMVLKDFRPAENG